MRPGLLEPGARVAIAGAGCSGSSLAAELLARCPGIRVSIYDPAPRPNLQRIWCSWEVDQHRFTRAVSKRWTKIAVRSPSGQTVIDTPACPYACVRAEDFFAAADDMLSVPDCTVHRGTAVERIDEHDTGVDLTLRTPEGEVSRRAYALVFDGRPPAAGTDKDRREPMLLQHFGGVELDTSATPADAATATLMDFRVSQEHGSHFMYVLPFSQERVLVESTFITPSVGAGIDYEGNALAYARDELGLDTSRVVYRESGVLPMTLRPLGQKPTARVWPIGTRAGIARASSGYAFHAIQRDTRRVVDALLEGRADRPGPPRSRLLGAMDRALLSLLSNDQSAAPNVFGQLFAGCAPDRLVRFLADVPRPLDYVAVMLAMPKLDVAGHVLSHPSSWPRVVR